MDDEQFIKYYINRKFLKFNISLYKEPLAAQMKSIINASGDSSSTLESPKIKPGGVNFMINL